MLSDWMESRGVSLAGELGVFYEWSRSEREARGQVAAGPGPTLHRGAPPNTTVPWGQRELRHVNWGHTKTFHL